MASQNSQNSRKVHAVGLCSVCKSQHRVHGTESLIYRHGPHDRPCPGSGRPALAQNQSVGQTVDQPNATGSSQSQPTIFNQPVGPPLDHNQGPLGQAIDHPPCSGPIIKNIPKAARPACCSQLFSLLQKVLKDPNDLDCWSNLLSFGPTVLAKPSRAGKKHNNIANQIIKRCGTNRDNHAPSLNSSNSGTGTDPPKTFRDGDIGSLVASKKEDGNLRAAVRILISDESLAPFTMDTATKLQAKHPQENPTRGPIASPNEFTPLRISEADVKTAISSFPAGSAGGSYGLRPNHMSQLLSCRESSQSILLDITALINLLLSGTCPPEISRILFGGRLVALNKNDGGVRPIAIGYYWRRLASKCASASATMKLKKTGCWG